MKDKKSTEFESTFIYYNNLVDTCNIALILFFKCDVPKFRIPPPSLSHNVILRRLLSPPLTCDIIYGCPLGIILVCKNENRFPTSFNDFAPVMYIRSVRAVSASWIVWVYLSCFVTYYLESVICIFQMWSDHCLISECQVLSHLSDTSFKISYTRDTILY